MPAEGGKKKNEKVLIDGHKMKVEEKTLSRLDESTLLLTYPTVLGDIPNVERSIKIWSKKNCLFCILILLWHPR